MKKILPGFLFSWMSLCLGCATNEAQQFEKLKVGMDKSEVLEVMGSPRRAERHQGTDHWTYKIYKDNRQDQKEIQFQDGKSTYLGEIIKPKISAEEQDRRNEESNLALEGRWAEERDEYQKRISGLPTSDQSSKDAPAYSPKFEPVQ